MTTLRFTLCALLVATACSKSDSRDSSAPPATKIVEAPIAAPAVAPAPVAAPTAAPTEKAMSDEEIDARMEKAAEERLMAEADEAAAKKCEGSAPQQGVCVLQKIANVIDTSGIDCDLLAKRLAPLSKDVTQAMTALVHAGKKFDGLKLPKDLVAQRKRQAEVIAACSTHPKAKEAMKWTLGEIAAYDNEYQQE